MSCSGSDKVVLARCPQGPGQIALDIAGKTGEDSRLPTTTMRHRTLSGTTSVWLALATLLVVRPMLGYSAKPDATQRQARPPRDTREEETYRVNALSDLQARGPAELEAVKDIKSEHPWPLEPVAVGMPGTGIFVPDESILGVRINPAYVFGRRLCSAGAIAYGAPLGVRVVFNATKTELLTITTFSVDRWLKPRAGSSKITLGRRGGRVLVQDDLYITRPESGLTLGQHYIIFLEPHSAYYRELGSTSVSGANGRVALYQYSGSLDEVLASVREQIGACSQ